LLIGPHETLMIHYDVASHDVENVAKRLISHLDGEASWHLVCLMQVPTRVMDPAPQYHMV